MAYTDSDMKLFETLRRLDADCAEMSNIAGFGIFVGESITPDEDGDHGCVSFVQFSDEESFFKLALMIAADEEMYERITLLTSLAEEIHDNLQDDEE